MPLILEIFDGENWNDKTSKCTSLTWSISSRRLEKIDFTLIDEDVSVGQRVRLKQNGNIVFEGVVYERRKHHSDYVSVEATAYSNLVLYDRHIVFRIYEAGTTAGAILRDLASLEENVDVSNVDDGPALIQNWEIQNIEALKIMLDIAKSVNYWLRMKPNFTLYFKPKQTGHHKASIDSTKVISAEYCEDRWRLKNRVVYVGCGGQVLADVSEGAGDLPVVVHDPFLTDPNEALRRANTRLALNKEYGRQLRIMMHQDDFETMNLDLGDTVRVNLPSLGLTNVDMYLVEIEHDPVSLKYILTLGGKLELFEELFEETIGGDVASRFGGRTSVEELLGSLNATVTSLQAAQKIQALGRTVRVYDKPPMIYENGVNITLDGDGNIVLSSGFTYGSFEFSWLPSSELFTRWLRTQYIAELNNGVVKVDLRIPDGTTLFSNIPPDFDIPYYPQAMGAATSNALDWDAVNAVVTETDIGVVGMVAIKATKTSENMTLIWPKTRNANYDILRYFRIYFYTFNDHLIMIKLCQDDSNYLTAMVYNSGGSWMKWDILTSSMARIGSPSKVNYIEITTSAPLLLIDSDYLLYPLGREKLIIKFNLSRTSVSNPSPKIRLVKITWREGK